MYVQILQDEELNETSEKGDKQIRIHTNCSYWLNCHDKYHMNSPNPKNAARHDSLFFYLQNKLH